MWGFVVDVGKHISSNVILAECGRCGLYVDYYIKCVKYWC